MMNANVCTSHLQILNRYVVLLAVTINYITYIALRKSKDNQGECLKI